MLIQQTIVYLATLTVLFVATYNNVQNAKIQVYLYFRMFKTTLVLAHHRVAKENLQIISLWLAIIVLITACNAQVYQIIVRLVSIIVHLTIKITQHFINNVLYVESVAKLVIIMTSQVVFSVNLATIRLNIQILVFQLVLNIIKLFLVNV